MDLLPAPSTLILKTSGRRPAPWLRHRQGDRRTRPKRLSPLKKVALYPALYHDSSARNRSRRNGHFRIRAAARSCTRLRARGRKALAAQTAEWARLPRRCARLLPDRRVNGGKFGRFYRKPWKVASTPKSTRTGLSSRNANTRIGRRNGLSPDAARREAERRLGNQRTLRTTLGRWERAATGIFNGRNISAKSGKTSHSPRGSSGKTRASPQSRS